MHKTIYGRSAKRVQYEIENHIYKKDTTKKKETSKQTNQKWQEESQNPTNSLKCMEMYENKNFNSINMKVDKSAESPNKIMADRSNLYSFQPSVQAFLIKCLNTGLK